MSKGSTSSSTTIAGMEASDVRVGVPGRDMD